MQRTGLIFIVLLLVVALAASGGFYWLTRSGMPRRDGEAVVPGLSAAVEVRWDAWAVPHLIATSDLDLAAAMGYLHANDRIVQMELGRRLAAGRLAEIVGEAALPSDRHFRSLGFPALARGLVGALGEESRSFLAAYAAGVNAWLQERGSDLPPELRLLRLRPEPWQLEDSMYFLLLMQHELSFWNARPEEARFQLLRALGAERVRDLLGEPELWIDPEIAALASTAGSLPVAADPARDAAKMPAIAAGSKQTPVAAAVGSNNWAIGGSRTRTGRPIVANDPHLPLRLPGFWYQATLRGPGYEAAGVTLAGFPFIVLGQGRDVAWAFTNVMLDDHDLFFEQFDDTGDRVRRADGWLELTVSTEQIALPDGGTEELRLRRSDLGVVLEADAERGLPARSLAWTGATAGDPAAVFLQLARARSVEDLPGRLDAYVAPAQNLVVADRDGGLLYTAIGRVPERPLGDGRLPVPAWKPDYRWAGLLPQALNPTRLRPADGLIVTANHDIRLPDDSEAPVAMTADFDTPHRALRIEELLQASTDWTVEAMGRVQTDTVSLFARQLSELLAKAELSGEAGRAVALLTAWDGEMDGYGAAALAALVERELTRAIFADEGAEAGVAISPTRGILLRALRGDMLEGWFDDLATPEIEDRTTTLARAVGAAWTIANERWGPDPADWPYGESHTLRLDNPLGTLPVIGSWFNRGPISLPGSATTVAAFGGRWDGETYPVLYGPSMRWISDLSDPDASLAVLPAGQSGHPADPHYDDQLPLYLSGRLRAVHWSEEAIIDATRSVLVLRPASQ